MPPLDAYLFHMFKFSEILLKPKLKKGAIKDDIIKLHEFIDEVDSTYKNLE